MRKGRRAEVTLAMSRESSPPGQAVFPGRESGVHVERGRQRERRPCADGALAGDGRTDRVGMLGWTETATNDRRRGRSDLAALQSGGGISSGSLPSLLLPLFLFGLSVHFAASDQISGSANLPAPNKARAIPSRRHDIVGANRLGRIAHVSRLRLSISTHSRGYRTEPPPQQAGPLSELAGPWEEKPPTGLLTAVCHLAVPPWRPS
jgi:hypothetical protein